MTAVVEVVLPVFGLILVGYLAGLSPLLSEEGIRGVTNFVFYVAMPALLFRTMSGLEVPDAVDPDIIVAYFSAAFLVYFATAALGRAALALPADEAALMGMGGAFSNVVLLGIPLILLAFGERGLVAVMFIVAFHPILLIALPTVMVELARGSRGGAGRVLGSVTAALMRNPVILSIVLGFAFGATGWELPKPIATPIDMLKAGAGPAALFALGATLTTFRIGGHLKDSLIVVAIKLIVLPGAVWVMCSQVFALEPIWTAVATVTAAMPTGANAFLLARTYDRFVARSATVILLSTALSVVTVAALLAMLGRGG